MKKKFAIHSNNIKNAGYKEWYQVVKHNYIYLAIWWR